MATRLLDQVILGISGYKYVTLETVYDKTIKGRLQYYGCGDEDEICIQPDNSSTGIVLYNSDIRRIIGFSND